MYTLWEISGKRKIPVSIYNCICNKNDLKEMMYDWKASVTLCACFQKMYMKHNDTFISMSHRNTRTMSSYCKLGRYIKLITHIHRKHTFKIINHYKSLE